VLSTALNDPPPEKTKKRGEDQDANKEYVMRTGAVHETIERIRKELPEDNLAAVRRRWNTDKGMLQDTMEDVNGIIEDAAEDEDDDGEDEGFGSDDDVDGLGLDELGFTETKLSKSELERVKKIQPLIRICVLLHKRVLLDLLNPKATFDTHLYAVLDTLPPLSHKLLLATEEIVAVLYAPQNPVAMSSAVTVLDSAVRELQETLTQKDLLPPPPASLEAVDGDKKKEKYVRKWYETCFDQIHKLYSTLRESLDAEGNAA